MTDPAFDPVLVLARSGFLSEYVAEGLRQTGLAVVGPIASAGQVDHGSAAFKGAVIDVELPLGELLLLVEALRARGVPIVLICGTHAQLPDVLQEWPVLRQPFASFQIAEQLCTSPAARSSGTPSRDA